MVIGYFRGSTIVVLTHLEWQKKISRYSTYTKYQSVVLPAVFSRGKIVQKPTEMFLCSIQVFIICEHLM